MKTLEEKIENLKRIAELEPISVKVGDKQVNAQLYYYEKGSYETAKYALEIIEELCKK